MNIGIVTTWFASGAGYVSKTYADMLSDDHDIFIYGRGGKRQLRSDEWQKYDVTWGWKHPCNTGIYTNHFKKWITKKNLHCVIFNEQRFWRPVIEAKKLGKLVGAYVDYYTQDTFELFRLYDFLICNTKRHYHVFKKHPNCLFLPWGVDTNVFRPVEKRFGFPVRFLISAGWDGTYAKHSPWLDRRGAGLAMRAFHRLKGEAALTVLSQVPLSECPSEWQELVKGDTRIDFRCGHFREDAYSHGDVYVYPSRLDGIGLTLPEALSSGLPAITTDSPPMNEFVTHQHNGLLVRPKEYRGRPDGYYWAESVPDEGALFEAMQYYVLHPEKVVEHGKSARQSAENKLSIQSNFGKLSATLNLMIQNRKIKSDDDQLYKKAMQYDSQHSQEPHVRLYLGARSTARYFLFYLADLMKKVR